MKNNVKKNKDYILFLEKVINACGQLAMKTRKMERGNTVKFSVDCTDEQYKVGEPGWGNRFTHCVFNALNNKSNHLKIFYDFDGIEEHIEISGDAHDIEAESLDVKLLYTKEALKEQIVRMKQSFINEEIVNNIERKVNCFSEIICERDVTGGIFSLTDIQVENYLSAYYSLLSSFLVDDDIYTSSLEKKEFLRELLLLDSVYDEEDDDYVFKFTAPVIMNKLQKVNRGIEEFYRIVLDLKEEPKQSLLLLYRRIMLTKVKHLFRWNVAGRNKELYHAAMANYVEQIDKQWKFKIIAKNIKEYDSYEGIGELRLAEKILYELNQRKKQKFKVAIVGDVWFLPVEEMHTYICNKIQRMGEKVEVYISIYTKNEVVGNLDTFIKHRGKANNILKNKENLTEVIKEHDVLFLLDCIELYQICECGEKEQIDYYRQRFSFNKYYNKSLGFTEYEDICHNNMLEELYDSMTTFCQFNYMGRMQKRANEALLNFCESECERWNTVAYIYVSDLSAFERIYNDYRFYVRTEKYNEKEIGIIRFSKQEVEFLENGNSQMIVFNMWQFLKHIALEERENWIISLSKNANIVHYQELKEILIGIDYSEWKKKLQIHYYINEYDEKYKEKKILSNKFVKEVLLPVLNGDKHNMYNAYIEKAMASFFYSMAKNVEDMVFLHLFENRRDILGNAQMADNNNPQMVLENKDDAFKYSLKRFYSLITSHYDISATDSANQFRTRDIIFKNAKINSRIDKEHIYRNVIKACEKMQYQDSYLAQNCNKEII